MRGSFEFVQIGLLGGITIKFQGNIVELMEAYNSRTGDQELKVQHDSPWHRTSLHPLFIHVHTASTPTICAHT